MTIVAVYLQGKTVTFTVDLPLIEVIKLWESSDNLIIPERDSYTYIRKDQCPIVEFYKKGVRI